MLIIKLTFAIVAVALFTVLTGVAMLARAILQPLGLEYYPSQAPRPSARCPKNWSK